MLTFHIIAGSFLLLFGVMALSVSKGQYKHRLSGNLFFCALLLMAASVPNLINDPVMALLTVYYGTTAWAIVLRKENSTGVFEIVAMLLAVTLSGLLFYFVSTSSLPPTFTFILYSHAIIIAVAAMLDLKMILSGGLSGKHRIARHAWRTCFALLGAVMSFSVNTDKYWPDFVNNNALIYLTICVLIYWVVRVLFSPWFERVKHTIGHTMLTKNLFAKQS